MDEFSSDDGSLRRALLSNQHQHDTSSNGMIMLHEEENEESHGGIAGHSSLCSSSSNNNNGYSPLVGGTANASISTAVVSPSLSAPSFSTVPVGQHITPASRRYDRKIPDHDNSSDCVIHNDDNHNNNNNNLSHSLPSHSFPSNTTTNITTTTTTNPTTARQSLLSCSFCHCLSSLLLPPSFSFSSLLHKTSIIHLGDICNPDQITAMLSNYSTSYNVVNISLVLPILLVLYPPPSTSSSSSSHQQEEEEKEIADEKESLCASSLIAGMILGQLVGGTLGDVIGRTNAMYLVMLLQIASSLGSSTCTTLATGGGRNEEEEWGNFLNHLAVWRFILGVGAGGVYPLAAVLSAEQTSRRQNGGGSHTANSNDRRDDDNDHDDVENDRMEQHNGDCRLHRDKIIEETEEEAVEAEKEEEKRKLRLIALTFSTQGLGFLSVPLITYLLLLVLGEKRLDVVWRIILGLGAVPGIILLLLRWRLYSQRRSRAGTGRMEPVPVAEDVHGVVINDDDNVHAQLPQGKAHPEEIGMGEDKDDGMNKMPNDENDESLYPPLRENEGHTQSQTTIRSLEMGMGQLYDNEEAVEEGGAWLDDDASEDESDPQSAGLWSSLKSEPNLILKLLGTAGTWFLFDVLFYGNTLFEPIVLEAAFGGGSQMNGDPSGERKSDFELLVKTARDGLVLSTIALPGYFISILLVGRRTCRVINQTPRYVQMQGFALVSILYGIIGTFWLDLTRVQWLLLLLYGLTFFFANYGPNTTTFMLPSVTYSPQCRSTLNGISAAAGKAGALLGATLFEPAADALGDNKVMLICSGVSVVALIMTRLCVIVTR